jgi:hypothetical protein
MFTLYVRTRMCARAQMRARFVRVMEDEVESVCVRGGEVVEDNM